MSMNLVLNQNLLIFRCYAEVDPDLLGIALAQHDRRNVAAVASRWRHCIRFGRPTTSHTVSDVFNLWHDKRQIFNTTLP